MFLFCQRIHLVEQGPIALVKIAFRATGTGGNWDQVAAVFSGQETSCQRAVGDDAETIRLTNRGQFALELVAMDQVIVRLEAVITRQAVPVRGPERLHQFPC
jgi:hypothetical protein